MYKSAVFVCNFHPLNYVYVNIQFLVGFFQIIMFEAQSRGQPKLVYAHASNNDLSRDQEGDDMSSYVRNLVARIAKEEMNNNQQLPQHKQQPTETGMRVNSLQPKQELEISPAGDKDISLQMEQQYQPKLIDMGHGAERKRPSESDISVRRGYQPGSVAQRMEDAVKESNKRHIHPSAVYNGKLQPLQIEIVKLRASEGGAPKPVDKLTVGTKLDTVLPVSSGAASERLKSAGSSSTTSRIETIPLVSATTSKAKNAESAPTAAPTVKVAPTVSLSTNVSAERIYSSASPLAVTNTEKVYSSSSPSTVVNTQRVNSSESPSMAIRDERKVMLLTYSESPKNVTPAELITTAEKVAPVSQASIASIRGKFETAPSLSKSATVGTMSTISPGSAPHVSSISINPSNAITLNQSTVTPKQIYSSSSTSTSNVNSQHKNNITEHKNSVHQHEDSAVLLAQRHAPENQSKQTQDAQLHATTIKIHNYPLQRQQTSMLSQSGNSDPSLSSYSETPISSRLQSLTTPSSQQISETPSPVEQEQDSELLIPSQNICVDNLCSGTPKSILKTSASFDKGNTLLISGNDNGESADYCDSSSQKSTKHESFSVKKHVQSFFKIKTNSPPPQLKRHVTVDMNTAVPELSEEGRVAKKSVTFNSEVRLHLDNDESLVETLPVDG